MTSPPGPASASDSDNHRTGAPSWIVREVAPASGRRSTAGVAKNIGRAGGTVENALVTAQPPRPEGLRLLEAGELVPFAIRINEVHTIAPWSRSTTYALVKSGRLRAKKLGRCTFVLRADLWALIDELEDVVPR